MVNDNINLNQLLVDFNHSDFQEALREEERKDLYAACDKILTAIAADDWLSVKHLLSSFSGLAFLEERDDADRDWDRVTHCHHHSFSSSLALGAGLHQHWSFQCDTGR
ncbi:hypothetical protein AVEN_150827-1 [Araneus ventricosus]|uniref:Uncharacterized protein n=1 Tax=Araneus ventricosus TaxID=182803 RepID=A0A4Y1ZX85_ARAVE|nr:hypothetical protein AVEN_150827-1 [Araneus ventricosus]